MLFRPIQVVLYSQDNKLLSDNLVEAGVVEYCTSSEGGDESVVQDEGDVDTRQEEDGINGECLITKVKTDNYSEVGLQKGCKELCFISYTYNPGWFENTLNIRRKEVGKSACFSKLFHHHCGHP